MLSCFLSITALSARVYTSLYCKKTNVKRLAAKYFKDAADQPYAQAAWAIQDSQSDQKHDLLLL